ncbi:MAG TPA: FAD-binding protein [Sorangium sp.]|nr:FAD-binding protein [Sorangium sp.]
MESSLAFSPYRPWGLVMTTIPGFKGQLTSDVAKRGEMSDDFGHVIHNVPALCATPEDAEDISLLVKWAAAQSPPLRCAARGIGHSAFGQAQVPAGVAIDMGRITRAVVSEDRKTITVGCGAPWDVVIDAAARHGLRVPVTTANPFLTIGGSLSLAAMDYTSSTVGAAVDHLLDVTIVTGTGEIVVCSRSRSEELFDAVRCGLGEYGIMVEATFPLVPAPKSVLSFWLVYDDFERAYTDMRAAHANPLIQGNVLEVIPRQSAWYLGLDYAVQFQVRTGRMLFPFIPSLRSSFMYLLTLIVYIEEGKDPSETDILRNLNPVKHCFVRGVWNNRDEQQSYREWKKFLDGALALGKRQRLLTRPNIVLSMFLAENDRSKTALKQVVDSVKPESIRRFVVNFAVSTYTRSAFQAPGFMAPSDCENFIMFNVIRSVPDATPEESQFATAFKIYGECDRLWDMVKKMAVPPGEPLTGYAWGYLPCSWQEYFGKHWERQARWKRMFDPGNILGGCNMFGR